MSLLAHGEVQVCSEMLDVVLGRSKRLTMSATKVTWRLQWLVGGSIWVAITTRAQTQR